MPTLSFMEVVGTKRTSSVSRESLPLSTELLQGSVWIMAGALVPSGGGPGAPPQPGMPRFPGPGRQLPSSGFTPFSGQAQRIPDESGAGLRAQALAKMQEVGAQKSQRRRAAEMLDRQGDLRRALRRGGERGDVVPLGKRKNEFGPGPFSARQRVQDRPDATQRFTMY